MKLVTEILEITAHPSMDSTFVIHPLEPEFQLENDLPEQLYALQKRSTLHHQCSVDVAGH